VASAVAARVARAEPAVDPSVRRRRRRRRDLPVRTRLVLRTLAVFNGGLLVVLGAISLGYVDRPAGPIGAGCLWLASGFLFGLAHALGRGTGWG
jgi:hypothetical protein